MEFDIYTSTELYAVMFDPQQMVSTSQWRRLVGTTRFFSDQQDILFDKLQASRRIAPFMMANVAGRPIYRKEGERIYAFRPAYTKPKDAVLPGEMMQQGPAELVRRVPLQTPESRYNQAVINIARYHRGAIERLWDYMVAASVIDGQLTINYMTDQGLIGHSVTIDFERDPAHRIILGGAQRWGQVGVNIFNLLQTWIDTVGNASFGGVVNDMLLGSNAALAFINSADIEKKLNTDLRGSEEVYVNRGLIRTDPLNPFTYIGTLGSGTSVWKVSGPGNQFQQDDKTLVDILSPNDALLLSPSVEMIEAYGAIQDVSSLRAQDIFVKMWDQNDPSARFIMTQSAPLAIPVNPNATLLATVM